jgi:hypothetical protein
MKTSDCMSLSTSHPMYFDLKKKEAQRGRGTKRGSQKEADDAEGFLNEPNPADHGPCPENSRSE